MTPAVCPCCGEPLGADAVEYYGTWVRRDCASWFAEQEQRAADEAAERFAHDEIARNALPYPERDL